MKLWKIEISVISITKIYKLIYRRIYMKILLITPNFFDYPKIICDELKRMGHEIDWYDDRPSTSSIMKAIIRINKKYVNKIIDR